MKAVKFLPGKAIRVLDSYVLFYSVYDEDLISAFKEAKLKWDRDRRVWYADLHDFQSTRDFLDKLSGVLSYFPQEEILYAAHFINSFYCKLSNVIELSRKENSNFPVPVPEGLSLYPYQRAGVEFLVNRKNVLLADSMGLGKEEWVDNRVWISEGRKKIGDLKVGEKIFGPSGKPVNVTGVYPQGKKKLYRVTFDDGCSVLVGLDHLWFVVDKRGFSHVLTTRQIMDRADMNELRIPVTRPLHFQEKTEESSSRMLPYLSGLILSNEISLKNSFKSVNDSLKYASMEKRILFLQGFLDNVKKLKVKNSEIHIYIPQSRIRRDITELIHSLGGLVIERKKTKTLIIKLPQEVPPFRHRKVKYSPSKILIRKFKSIKYAKTAPAVCIQVDSPDCLYLTEHAIVTHNTVQVIGYLNYQSKITGKIPQSLVICPSSVKYNWAKELNKWSINPVNIEVLEGRNGFKQNPYVDIYICNYDILQDKEFKGLNCVVVDEVHYIKNLQALRTKEVQRICKSNPQAKIIALTGTPMLNRPAELFPILNLLLPHKFDSFYKFAHKYCAAYKKQIHTRDGIKEFWDFSGASNTEELGRLLRATVMLRREKSQVLKELPEKIRTVIPVKKQTGKIFSDLERTARGIIEKIKEINRKIRQAKENEDRELLNKLRLEKTHIRSVAFGLLNEYRRYAFEEKKDILVDFIADCLESEPVVVFIHHRDVAGFFRDTFKQFNPLVVTGQSSASERAKLVEIFQSSHEYPLFIASILAAAEGITLTKASTVVFAEYEWTPAKMLQAEGRTHRIGQKNTVNSYWFALTDSIDELFIHKILEKLKLEHEIMQDTEEEEIFLAVD